MCVTLQCHGDLGTRMGVPLQCRDSSSTHMCVTLQCRGDLGTRLGVPLQCRDSSFF